jgi:hypothetical protein
MRQEDARRVGQEACTGADARRVLGGESTVELGKRVLYIAGPIANTTDFVDRFTKARLEVSGLGYHPICPIELNGIDTNSRKEDAENRRAYLKRDISALIECDGIYLLRGWENSRGARLEKLIADGLDMLVLYQESEDESGRTSNTNADTA